MKLPLVVAAYRRHERGELDLDAEVRVHDDFGSAYDGSRVLDGPGRRPGRRDLGRDRHGGQPCAPLARHAIVKSGNLATNLLLEHVGTRRGGARCCRTPAAPRDSVLPAGSRTPRPARPGLDNLVTAADLARVISASGRPTGSRTPRPAARSSRRAGRAGAPRRQSRPGCPPAPTSRTRRAGSTGSPMTSALVAPTTARRTCWPCAPRRAPEETLYALNAAVSAAVWAGCDRR